MKNQRRPGSGYSLVEMMVTITIIGILAVLGPNILVQIQNFFLSSNAKAEIQRDARTSLNTIIHFIQQAQSSSVVIDTPANGGPYSLITFTLIDGRQVTFWQDGNRLLQKVVSASGVPNQTTLTKNLSSLVFSFPVSNDPTNVTIGMSMSKGMQLGRKKTLELIIQPVKMMNQ